MTLKTVVLPAPFGPIRPASSPGRRSKLKSQTAFKPPNCMVTSSSLRSGASLIGAPSLRSCRAFRGRRLLPEQAAERQLLRAEQALRARDHEDDEHERVDDHA